MMLWRDPMWFALLQKQEPGWTQALQRMLAQGLEVGTLLLTFTLAIFVVLVFGVRVLMTIRKLPIPVDPFDMAKPKDFRALMLVAAVVLAPLVVLEFFSPEGVEGGAALLAAYVFEIPIAVLLWFALHLFYSVREKRSRR